MSRQLHTQKKQAQRTKNNETWRAKKKEKKEQPKESVKKPKEGKVKSHYGQVENKTRTTGSQGKENIKNASVKRAAGSVKEAYKGNVRKTHESVQSGKKPVVKSHYGNVGSKVTPVKVQPITSKSWTPTGVAKGVKKAVNVHGTDKPKTENPSKVTVSSHYGQVAGKATPVGKKYSKRVGYDDSEVKDYIGKDGTAGGTAAGKAYNRAKTAQEILYNAGKKTVTVDTEKEKKKNAEGIYTQSTKSAKNQLEQVYDSLYDRLGTEYDKLVDEYGETAVARQLGSKKDYIESSIDTKENYVNSSLEEGKEDRIKDANAQAEEDSKFTYSKAPVSTNQALIEQNASLLQNNKVKTKTDQDKYVTDKDGNVKYDIQIDDDFNVTVKPKKKKGKEKVETTQGANILDYYARGFNEKGELASQKGSQKVADTRAGAIHDAPFFAGALQGSSYGDITRGLGQYSRAAGKAVDETKHSGAFLAGYMGGIAGQFTLGGATKMTDAFVKGVTKNGLERAAKNIGIRKGAMSTVFESPINALDAAKMATDSQGNFDKKTFLGYMALNSGLSGGIGGIIGGVGSKMTKSQARDFIALSVKNESGVGLTEAEIKRLEGFQQKFDQIRESGNVANTDIVNKAEYDAIVAKRVFDNGGTAQDAFRLMDNVGTNVEKMNVSAAIKENADVQFSLLKAERDNILDRIKTASPEEVKTLGQQAANIRREMTRLGEISNTAEKSLKVAQKQNETSLRDLTNNLKTMSKRTGIEYKVVADAEMRKEITAAMARSADNLEAELKNLSGEERAAMEARINELRQGASDEDFYRGFYYKDENGETKILINSDSPQAYQTVVGHETGHLIKAASEEEFEALGATLENFAKKWGDYDAVVEELKRAYPEATETELREEVTCELLGRYVFGANDKVLKKIAGENPSLITRIVDYLKELLGKTTDRQFAKELTAIIDKTERLTENVGRKLTKDGKVKEGTYSVDENIPTKQLDESGAIVEKDGKPVAQFDKDGSFKMSVSTYEESGRAELKKYVDNLVKTGEMSEKEAKQLVDDIEDMYKICKKYADSGEYAPFSTWSMAKVVVGEDGKPVFTSVRKNSEYPMNLDFSTICKKRRTLDAVFNELIRRGVMDDLDLTALGDMKFMAAANDTIRKYGFEAACEICFVEARRYRQRGTAKQFANMYNELVDSMTPDKSKISSFNYGKDETVTEVADGIHTMDDSAVDTSYLDRVIEEEKTKAIQNLEKKIKKASTTKEEAEKFRQSIADIQSGEKEIKTVRADAARFLKENPSQRQYVQIGDLMSSNGFEGMQVQNPELMKLYNRKKGTGGAKSTFGDVQYMNEIINSKTFNREAAYAVAGVRAQSFSDYVPRMVFDYIQMVGDLAAKRLPMHVYTKEPLFVKQFGLTGMKINMSLIPDNVKGGKAAGLDANGNYVWNTEGTFPYDEAVKLQNAEGYKDNVGTIAVGVSNEHIRKMLGDPNIQMIIPYHKSSLDKRIAKMRNVGDFEDYTKVQTTKDRSGKSISEKDDFPFNEELYKLSHGEDGKLLPMEEWGDPRELANRYLTWCEENGYQPKFPDFADHPNYYKLLEDFGLYDRDGNFKPQHDVQAKFPTDGDAFGSMKNLIKSGLEEDAILEGKRIHDIPAITDEIIENAKGNGWLPKDAKYSKAGRKAVGADTTAADLAVKLKKDGMSNDEIKEITGWYVGADGKPRFEFSDAGFKIKDSVYADYHSSARASDNAYITARERRDDAMRAFYKEAQTTVRGEVFDIMLQSADKEATTKELRLALRDAAKDGVISKDDAKIDSELASLYAKYVNAEKRLSTRSRGREHPDMERLARVIDHDELFKYYPDAREIKVEFVDKLDSGLGQYNPKTNTITVMRGRSKDEMEETLIHEIQHWIQQKEHHAHGASTAYWRKVHNNIEELQKKIFSKLSHEQYMEVINAGSSEEAGKIVGKYLGREKGRLYTRLDTAERKIAEVSGDDAFESYWSTLGEKEARDTADHRHKTQEEINNSDAPLYAEQDTLVREDFDQFSGNFDDLDFKASQESRPPKDGSLDGFKFSQSNRADKITPKTVTDSSGKVTRDAKRAYDAAVKAGDMDTAQKYVDAVLEARGYTIKAYHGTDTYGFTKFDLKKMAEIDQQNDGTMMIFAAADKEVAQTYISEGAENAGTYSARLRMDNPLVIDCKGKAWKQVPLPTAFLPKEDVSTIKKIQGLLDEVEHYRGEKAGLYRSYPELFVAEGKSKNFSSVGELKAAHNKAYGEEGNEYLRAAFEDDLGRFKYKTREIGEMASGRGYDGVVFKNVWDNGGRSHVEGAGMTDIYLVFNSSQFKVSDPVTRDKLGRVIPLDKRGNISNDNIKFSKTNRPTSVSKAIGGGRQKANAQKVANLATKEQRDTAQRISRLEKEHDRLWDVVAKSSDEGEVVAAVKRAGEIEKEIKSLRSPKETVKTPEPTTPKAETKSQPTGGGFRDTDEYRTFVDTPSSYASNRLKEFVEAAIEYGVDIEKRIAEFNQLNKEIRGIKGHRNNVKDANRVIEFNRQIEQKEVRQTAIAKSIYIDVADKRGLVASDGKFKTDTVWKASDVDDMSAREVGKAAEKIGGVGQIATDLKRATPNNKAMKVANEEVKNFDECLNNFIKGDPDKGLQNARATVIIENLAKKLEADPNDTKAISDLMRVVDVLGDNSTLPTNVRNSAKTLATATPKGRIGVAVNAVNTLNKKYAERIDGTLKLTEDELYKLATTEAGDELDALYKTITNRLWEDIPASRMEKFNEVRHMFMLANVRTHARNMGGNVSFRGVRRIADDVEIALQNHVFKSGIEKRGGTVDRVRVTGKEIKEHDEFLNAEFDEVYKKSGSVTRYMEIDRPDGVPVVKNKALNWMIQKDYKALETEDMFTFIPAFKKSYVQFCKAKGWDINALTEAQRKMAGERALFDAEYATFRDVTAFSSWVTGKKHWLAQKEGKTIFGTAMYRFMNAAMEGVLPFVKTPVNIFRRAVDFSPISLFRALAEMSSKDADTYILGIKHLSTGLTGTGIFGLGYMLTDIGHISIDTKLGSHSGSKYYDQDMGYQDYSIEVHVGKYHKSWTIDWLQPMEGSLFMGAVFHDMISDIKDGNVELGTDAIAGLFAVASPMLDASFMSSTKDMIETFERRASKETAEGEPDMRGAFTQMLLGDIPKNYVSSIVPQVVSQAANASDKYQRDTRSVLKDPVLAAWDSAGKQIINRIPVFRQFALNPKLDRWGEDKKTGRNVATRIFNCMLNPSNVKKINENKYDRELFKIRNSLDKNSDAYKNFFYNFTGNPTIELSSKVNGRSRMTYDELYTYGKANRIEQTERIHAMVDSDTYKDMTMSMRAIEVDSAHWIGNMVADHDTFGVNYAIKSMMKSLDPDANGNSRDGSDARAYQRYVDNAGNAKDNEKFWTWRVDKERLYARAHPSGDDVYRVKGLCAIQSGDQNLIDAVKLTGNKETELTHYWEDVKGDVKGLKGGNALTKAKDIAFKEISEFCCRSTSNLKKAKVESDDLGMISAAAGLSAFNGHKSNERTYRGMGQFWNSAQAGGGLMLKYNTKDGKYDLAALESYSNIIEKRIEKRPEGTTEKDVVMDFIENDLGITDADEAACVYQTLYLRGHSNPNSKNSWKNPYKDEIDDHLEWGENRDDEWGDGSGKGSGGHGRRGRRGHGRRGGGGGGGSTPYTPIVSTAGGAAKQTVSRIKVSNPFGTSNTSSDSNLNEAYRNRVKKLRKSGRKTV